MLYWKNIHISDQITVQQIIHKLSIIWYYFYSKESPNFIRYNIPAVSILTRCYYQLIKNNGETYDYYQPIRNNGETREQLVCRSDVTGVS